MKKLMHKKLDDYRALILDMDGTLYYQRPVRLNMFFSLVFYFFLNPHKFKELMIIRDYRKLRENRCFSEKEGFEQLQYKFLADKYKLPTMAVEKRIEYWMQDVPLSFVGKAKDRHLIQLTQKFQAGGGTVIVYSDYPLDKKLKTIGLKPNFQFYSGNLEIQCMKPDKRGLENILKITGFKHNEVLFIGDRYEKDGICAKNVDMEWIILPQSYRKRRRLYEMLGM